MSKRLLVLVALLVATPLSAQQPVTISGTLPAFASTPTVTVGTVPTDPFGANADAASATGSISAKLRFIAATGIPVTSVPTDPFGANADAASATGSISAKLRFIAATGIPITAVPSDPFGANADAASATGSLSAKLRFIASTGIPITGNVTVVQGTGTNLHTVCDSGCSGGTQYAEDLAHTNADLTTFVSGIRRDTTPSSSAGAAGDYTAFNIDANGRLYTNTAMYTPNGDSAMNDTADAVKVLNVDSTGAAITADTQGTHDTALGTITSITGGVWGGRADSSAVTNVTAGDWVAGWFDLAGRAHVTGDASMTALLTTPGGNVAHDAADAGNPVKIGFKATTSISGQTMVASADRTDAFSGIDGVQVVRLYSNLEDRVSATPVAVTDGSSTSLVAAQGAGIRFCATDITISNSSATNVTVDIRDGTAGAVLWTFPAAANMGGATHHFGQPLCTTANTAMATDPSAAASTVTTSVLGFKTKL